MTMLREAHLRDEEKETLHSIEVEALQSLLDSNGSKVLKLEASVQVEQQKALQYQQRLQDITIGLQTQHDLAARAWASAVKALQTKVDRECKAQIRLVEELEASKTPPAVSSAALRLDDAKLGALEGAVQREREMRQALALQREKEKIRQEMRAELEHEREKLEREREELGSMREAMRRDGEVCPLATLHLDSWLALVMSAIHVMYLCTCSFLLGAGPACTRRIRAVRDLHGAGQGHQL